MKIVIPSSGRADTITTPKYFDKAGIDYSVVVHTPQDKSDYAKCGIDPDKIVVSNAQKGISYIRQWIQDNMIAKGEWYLSLDDNVKGFTGVQPIYYDKFETLNVEYKSLNGIPVKWREIFDYSFDANEFMRICERMVVSSEIINVVNVGFATTDNFFFRAVKYRTVAQIVSKVVIRKNVGIRFDHNFNAIDDYAYNSECLLQYGKVLRNDWVFPVANHYEKGGIGTYEERAKMKIHEAALLMEKYPGLYRFNNKRKGVKNAEVLLKFHNPEHLSVWRRAMKGGGTDGSKI